MSLSDRRSFLSVLLALPVAACGFEPVYQQDTAALGLRGKVLLDTPTTEIIFDLNRALEDRLGATRDPIYGLRTTYQESSSALAVQGTAAITRYNLIGTSSYDLRDLQTGITVLSGTVDSFTSYSATSTTIATAAAADDARQRLSNTLSDLIISDLLVRLPKDPVELAPALPGGVDL
ncbi:MAG: hypothetical protein JJ894_09590 [Dinoroseobacter sp.]|nr:hypothetical protein [Dinoroseobacter sp.]